MRMIGGFFSAMLVIPFAVEAQQSPDRTVRDRAAAESIQVPEPNGVQVPPGYKPAWDDGRLNRYHGVQTLTGALQTARIWTQSVPRTAKTGPEAHRFRIAPSIDDIRGPAIEGRSITVIVPAPR